MSDVRRSREPSRARLFRHSPHDAWLVAVLLLQVAALIGSALAFAGWSWPVRLVVTLGLGLWAGYSGVIVAHALAHRAWFTAPTLDSLARVLASITVGFSVQEYALVHVRSHHVHDDGPEDLTTTLGTDGRHLPLWAYALSGVTQLLHWQFTVLVLGAARGFAVREGWVLELAVRAPLKRAQELRRIRFERAGQAVALLLLALVSWRFALLGYVPAVMIGWWLNSAQNHREHVGAPGAAWTFTGALYNRLTFNDGWHQEHHARPSVHWRELPNVVLRGEPHRSPRPALLR